MKCPVLVPNLFVSAVAAFAQTRSAKVVGWAADLSGAVLTRRRLSARLRSKRFQWKSPDARLDLYRALEMICIRTKWGSAGSLAALAVLAVLATHGAYGQSAGFAMFAGRAQDSQGASVAGATVTATNHETGIVRTTQTTQDGLYRFDDLPPGIYDFVIEARSFARVEVKHVDLWVGEQRDVNFNMKPAGEKQYATVTSEVPLIETTKTDVSTVIDERGVANLPTTTSYSGVGGVSNDFEGLAVSAPGVRYDYTGDSADLVGPGNVNDRGMAINVDGGNLWDQAQILVGARRPRRIGG